MASVIIVGTQWGDEGKGKIVDYLACKCEYVVRSQGGVMQDIQLLLIILNIN